MQGPTMKPSVANEFYIHAQGQVQQRFHLITGEVPVGGVPIQSAGNPVVQQSRSYQPPPFLMPCFPEGISLRGRFLVQEQPQKKTGVRADR